MDRAHFRHIGGSVMSDYGPVALATARAMMRTYRHEAERTPSIVAAECRRRAEQLDVAIASTHGWRRAGGWSDPEMADAPADHRRGAP